MKNIFDRLKEVQNPSVGILGCGLSGRAVYRFLRTNAAFFPHNLKIVLRDFSPDALSFACHDTPKPLCFSGEGFLDGLTETVLFRTPALRPDLLPIQKAIENGSFLTGEIALFCQLCPASIFSVTGSDGKTTTVSMTKAMLSEQGKIDGFSAFVGGNIGASLLDALPEITSRDAAVLELSSFQLVDFAPVSVRAAVLNVTENHLNWHKDMREYAASKRHILDNTAQGVLFADDETVCAMARPGDLLFSNSQSLASLKALFGERPYVYLSHQMVFLYENGTESPLFSVSCLKKPGAAFLLDAMAAAALTRGFVSRETRERALSGFFGVPHRSEVLGEYHGVLVIDSGADTTPSRTEATLSALSCRPTVLCGGSDKGLSFAPLARALKTYAARAVLTGETAQAIRSALPDNDFPVIIEPDFEKAVRVAFSQTPKGETLLLSPACASFDRFSGYRQRSHAFREILKEIQNDS